MFLFFLLILVRVAMRAEPARVAAWSIQHQMQTRRLNSKKEEAVLNLLSNLGAGAVVSRMPLSSGDAGVEETIVQMRKLIEQGKRDPVIRDLIAKIIKEAQVPAFSFSGEARAAFAWVLQNIRFTRDIYGVETLASARNIVKWGIGDCDDFTVLLCSLLGAIGHRCRIVTISKPNDEGNFSHVYPQDWINGQWVTLDAARMNPSFGKDPENVDRIRVWAISKDDYRDVQGLAGPSLRGPASQNPNALPGAYAPWVADPRFRNLRGHTLRGLGRYGEKEVLRALRGMRGMRGLGDVDLSDVAQLIQSGATGAANIISATRANPYNLYPTTATAQTSTALQNPLLAQQALLAQRDQTFGIPNTTLLWGGLGVAAVVLLASRH